jgi:hypothetical protein
MLASHDSYTYLNAVNDVANTITRFWRCQTKSITEQYKAGVRFFDIRVFRDTNSNGKKVWRTAHGFAELSKVYASLKAICVYFTASLKGCSMRIWLEKGTDEEWQEFITEIQPLIEKYPNLLQVVRKDPEVIYYESPTYKKMTMKYYPFQDWSVKTVLANLFNSPIKDWAEKHNPEITQEMIDDKDTLYMMDYI